MEKIFYKKGTSILVIAAILVIVLLLCMLLTFLAQKASFDVVWYRSVAFLEQPSHQKGQNAADVLCR